MGVKLPNGSTLSIASGYGTAKAFTALSNASEAVASMATGHLLAVGDIVEITSGWSKINQRIARIKALASDAATLEGVDTSDLVKFPAGGGIGSLRKVTGFTQITQVLDVSSSGGEQQFATYSFLEDGDDRQIPSNKSAQSMALQLGDDPTLPWYPVLSAADDDKSPRAVRLALPSGSLIFYNTYATLNKTPTLTKNQVMALQASLSLIAPVTRYAS